MKQKFNLSVAFLFLGFFFINAQSNYYYYKGERIPLTLDKQSVIVSGFNTIYKTSLKDATIKKFASQTNEAKINYAKIEYHNILSDSEHNQELKTLKNFKDIRTVSPNFITENGAKIGMSDYFYVKLKKPSDFEKLQQLAKQNNAQIIEQNEFMPLWYTLRCTEKTKDNTLEVANSFFETGWFAYSSPDFLMENDSAYLRNQKSNELKEMGRLSSIEVTPCANDPKFDEQWGLYNNSYPTIDLNACDAWQITKGAGVKVAIVDTGIELAHIDLADNISPISYDTESNSSPSKVYTSYGASHATSLAGIIGAIKDNNIQVTGIAPQSTLISISNLDFDFPNSAIKRANGINWAWNNGADIINNSWIYSSRLEAIDDAIKNALTKGRGGLGTVVVFSSGNDNGGVRYPANSNSNILSVGSIQNKGFRSSFSNYGNELDVVAPGTDIFTTEINNSTTEVFGTSAATAFVSGTAALILSVNPCLIAGQVNDIIEQTAQKIKPKKYSYSTHANRLNGKWNYQMGYGLVDAYAAVQMAQQTGTPLDLYIEDSPEDVGAEPNTVTGERIWTSEDIWARNNLDGIQQHQNPEYNPKRPNYVYVKVINRSLVASSASDQVKLYWRKAGIVSRWTEGWTGGYENINGETIQTNGLVGTASIPVLESGGEATVHFTWNAPNPVIYLENSSPWHFCLLARIVSEEDPMTNEQETYTSTNARNNNNIAWKNVTVVEAVTGSKKRKNIMGFDNDRSFGAVVLVGNPFDDARTFSIELIKEDIEGGKSIFDEAEVSLTMDETLYDVWKRSGKQSELLESTYNEKTKRVQGNHAGLNNLRFEPNEMGILDLKFSFLPEELTDKSRFVYHVVQKDAETGEVVGGETYIINKDSSPLIESSIKEYARVETKKDGSSTSNAFLDKIIPNPVLNTARITYNLGGAKSAHLMVVGFYHGATKTTANYNLNRNSEETRINMENYAVGFYRVALVCDGKIVDVKTLIKE